MTSINKNQYTMLLKTNYKYQIIKLFETTVQEFYSTKTM